MSDREFFLAAEKGVLSVNLSEFYNEVARHADTDKTEITIADTKRVLSEAFKVLAKMDACDSAQVIAKGLAAARKKAER